MRKYKYTTFLALVLSLLVFSSITACAEASGLKSQIFGKWVEVGVTESSIEFLKDGTVILVEKSMSAAGDYRFIDDKRLRVDLKGLLGTKVFEVSINSKTGELSLKEPNGKVSIYLTETELARRRQDRVVSCNEWNLYIISFVRRPNIKPDDPVHAKCKEKVDLPNSPYSIKVIDYVHDFGFDEKAKSVFSKSPEPNNPAVKIEIYKNGKLISTPVLLMKYPGILPAISGSEEDIIFMGVQ